MLTTTRALSLAALLILAPTNARADVLVVAAFGGPGSQYTDLQPAVNAAQPGDTLLVRKGKYRALNIAGKGLSVVAEQGASVKLTEGVFISDVPAGEVVLIRGLRIESPPPGFMDDYVNITDCDGPVWIEDCLIGNLSPPYFLGSSRAGVKVVDSDSVVFVGSHIVGGGNLDFFPPPGYGIRASGSGLTFLDCVVEAVLHTGWLDNSSGASGLSALGCEIFSEGSTFRGATGGAGFVALGCTPPGNGGSGIQIYSGTLFASKQNTFIGGSGGAAGAGFCSSGTPGSDKSVGSSATFVTMPGVSRTLEVPSPVREFDSFSLAFEAVPFEDVFLLVGSEPLGLFIQPLGGSLLAFGKLQILSVGKADATGKLNLALPVPPLSAGVESRDFYLQVAVINALGLGILGGGSAVTVLDASF